VSLFESRRGLSVASVVIGAVLLSSGAWTAEGDAIAPVSKVQRTEGPQDAQVEVEQAPAVKKAPDVQLPREAELRERVKARWEAVLKGEFDKAFGFETPEYRKSHTEQEYREQFGRRLRWHVATLKDLRYDRADEVEAIITLDYSFALPGSDEMARTTGDITEHWVYSEDQWWRKQPMPLLGGKTPPSLPK